MAKQILIDFETRSEVPIDYGIPNYAAGKHADILMMGWCIDHGPAKLWLPESRLSLPFIVEPDDEVYAFNAGSFDYRIWHLLGSKYYFPPVPLTQWRDVMAVCGRYTYPQSLGFAGEVLKLKVEKDKRGKELIKKICVPPFKYTQSEWEEFKSYCKDDINSMRCLIDALPSDRLTPDEQAIWELTQRINFTGLPVDLAMAKRITQVVAYAKKKMQAELTSLTDGEITSATQAQRIRKWANERGYPYDTLASEVLEEFMGSARADTLSALTKRVLQIRLDFGSSAVAKFDRVIEQCHRGRIYDNLIYYKANTGRWAGSGFQIHNLPRDSTEQPEELVSKFFDTSILGGDVIGSAKKLVRACITAPEGRRLAVADYHSIENVLLAWVSGAEDILDLHKRGLDEYIDFATQVFNIPYADVTKEQRRMCKPAVLGAGYGLAGRGLQLYAKSMGVDLTPQESDAFINIYRTRRPKVKDLWYGLKDAAILAIQYPGKEFRYRTCAFRYMKDRNGTPWLTLRLPSGRTLVYNKPKLVDGKYGLEVSHMGINSYTKKWARKKVSPGRFTENVIQATARDILVKGKFELEKEGYTILASIHDEIICDVDESYTDITPMCEIMCRLDPWAEGLPLSAEGAIVKRYTKI